MDQHSQNQHQHQHQPSLATEASAHEGQHLTVTRPDAAFVRPLTQIVETEDAFTLHLELPGVGKEGLEVTFENGELTVVGRRNALPAPGELIYRESRPVHFRRTFAVDASIAAGEISASLEQGVLTLRLPKSEAARPRRIEVAGSLN